MKVLVIYGGEGLSEEFEISKNSGLQVVKAALDAGFRVDELEINKDNIHELADKLADYDVIFPALHGNFFEDGQIQKILDDSRIPYVGSGMLASGLCWDKAIYKHKLDEAKILTPKWRIIKSVDEIAESDIPCVVKPAGGGASLDVLIINHPGDFNIPKIEGLLNKYGQLMLEEYIEGQEITVGVLGNKVLPVVEIVIPQDSRFDYESKYSGTIEEIVPPKNIPIGLQQRAQNLALEIHELMGCRYLSRTDMIVRGDRIYVLETNTMPGMTTVSLYPKATAAIGLDMPALIRKLIRLTYETNSSFISKG